MFESFLVMHLLRPLLVVVSDRQRTHVPSAAAASTALQAERSSDLWDAPSHIVIAFCRAVLRCTQSDRGQQRKSAFPTTAAAIPALRGACRPSFRPWK
jgi:hypothetical protein